MFDKVERMRKEAEENRKADPEMTEFIDLMKNEFGAKLEFLKINGRLYLILKQRRIKSHQRQSLTAISSNSFLFSIKISMPSI